MRVQRLAVGGALFVCGGSMKIHVVKGIAVLLIAGSVTTAAVLFADAPAQSPAPTPAPAAPAATAAPEAPPPGNPADGKKIFSVKCVPCHKADGSGGVKLTGNPTPDWRDAKRMADPKHNDAYLRDCITNGKMKSGMVAWSKQGVKPQDIENLIAYIHTFAKKK
jgi:mono/diheme cytochrome c family protein